MQNQATYFSCKQKNVLDCYTPIVMTDKYALIDKIHARAIQRRYLNSSLVKNNE